MNTTNGPSYSMLGSKWTKPPLMCRLFGHRRWLFSHHIFSGRWHKPQSDWLGYSACPRCGINFIDAAPLK